MARKAAADRGASQVLTAGRKGPVTYDSIPDDIRILVNATPVGTYPDNGKTPLDISGFKNLEGVLDLIYNPAKTALLLQAEKAGIRFSCGLPMLVAQATAAAEYFTGEKRYQKENEKIIDAIRKQMMNITLIGMPGSGKSSLGRELADCLGMAFADIDCLIEKETGMPPGQVIEEQGEEAFRNIESRILSRVSAQHGQVIAAGGGAILRSENRDAMRQNGPVVFIRRNIDALETCGRPLSKDLETMYKKRLPLYESCSDFSISNNSSVTDALTELSAIHF